ncbi:hypothetical protein [Nostoc sp.]
MNDKEDSMAFVCRLLVIAMLIYGVISGDIKLSDPDPVLIPVIIELIKTKEPDSKSDADK